MLDDDSYTVWSSVVAESVVFDLGAATAVSAYSWKTGTQTEGRYDPIRWTLEGSSAAGGPWAMVDDRSYRSVDVTTARREFAVAAPQQRNVQCASCDQHNEGTFAAKAQLPMYVLDWETRKREGHFLDGTHHRDGVALELIFQLANSVGAAPWLCVHHLAGDGYVREMAGLALQLLRPDLKLYLEHSNEVWNQLFPQGAFATMHGRRLGLADGLTSTARGNGTCVSYTLAECARHRYHAMRSKRIFEIWKEVWGAAGHAGRIVTVLSTHVAIPRTTRELLGWAGWGGNVSAHVDVVGVAGYFSAPSIKSAWAAHTAEMVHTAVRDHLPTVQSRLETQRGVAAEFGLKLITYEAGPALVQDDTIATGRSDGQVHEALIAASRHPGMEAVVSEGLTMVSTVTEASATRPLMYFVDVSTPSKYGAWGMMEHTDQAPIDAPKARAVFKFIDAKAGKHPLADCVRVDDNMWPGRGLGALSVSFVGPPVVTVPLQGDVHVFGQRYTIAWDVGGLARASLDDRVSLFLWKGGNCASATPSPSSSVDAAGGAHVPVATLLTDAPNAGTFSWLVPKHGLAAGTDYLFEVRRSTGPHAGSNYSEPFSVVSAKDAPPAMALFIEKDVDLLSAFHRDCKKEGQGWAIQPAFRISQCTYVSAEGCREYVPRRSSFSYVTFFPHYIHLFSSPSTYANRSTPHPPPITPRAGLFISH
jgi:hypothetical protein